MRAQGANTKGRLAETRRALALCRQVLPSLELKRQQLLAERARELHALNTTRESLTALRQDAGRRFPMLARNDIAIAEFVRVERIESREMKIIGTAVPVLADIHWVRLQYGLLAKPHWFDGALEMVRRIAHLRLEVSFAEERVRRIDHAILKVVQRINLFQKVLLPHARAEIQRIGIALADAERSAVVISKIFKARRQRGAGAARI
jgi:V/A-type H+-transporting ATPase subunit D